MRKKDSTPDESASIVAAPLGFLNYPPNAAMFAGSDTYIIVTNRKTAERVIEEIFTRKKSGTLPQ